LAAIADFKAIIGADEDHGSRRPVLARSRPVSRERLYACRVYRWYRGISFVRREIEDRLSALEIVIEVRPRAPFPASKRMGA